MVANLSRMAKIWTFLLFVLFCSLPAYSDEKPPYTAPNEQSCEQVMDKALKKLVVILRQNQFEQLESVLHIIQSNCGENEFVQRLRILRALIEKKTTGDVIASYLAKGYPETLIMRSDYSIEEKHVQIYLDNKDDFDFVPLRHPIDTLIRLKASALLNSPSYNLTKQEEKIVLLFADYIDEFYEADQATVLAPAQQKIAYSKPTARCCAPFTLSLPPLSFTRSRK